MKKGMVVPDPEIMKKLDALPTIKHNEFIVKAVRHSKVILVSACTFKGVMAFHPPYEIKANGEWCYTKLSPKEIDDAFKTGDVVYYNPYIKIRKLKDYI